MDNISASVFGEEQWLGLDAYNDRANIAPGNVARLENLTAEAGRLERRPGLVAQWTTNLPGPPQALRDVVQANGDIHIWFASGTGLYRYVPGDLAPVPITLPVGVTLAAANVVIRQIGGYVYICDGASHVIGGQSVGLFRLSIDGSSAPLIGLQVPNKPKSTALANLAFLPVPGQLVWERRDTPELENLIDEPDPDATNAGTGTEYWAADPTVAFDSTTEPGLDFAILAPLTMGIETRDAIALGEDDPDPDPGAIGDYPNVFHVRFHGRTKPVPGTITSRVRVILKLYDYVSTDLSDTPKEEREFNLGLMANAPAAPWECTFDCRDAAFDIKSVRLRIENRNAGISGDDPMVTRIILIAGGYGFHVPITANPAHPAKLTVGAGTVYASPKGGVCSDDIEEFVQTIPQETAFYTRDRRFYTTISTEDLTTTQRLVANLTLNYPATADVPLRLYVENGSAARVYSPLVYLTPNVPATINFDLTTGDTAVISAVTRVGIEFAGDVPTSGYAGDYTLAPTSSPTLLTVDFIAKPGNLTTDQTVTWRVEEWDSRTDEDRLLNVIRSDGSPLSDPVTPTTGSAVGVVTLAARVNSAAKWLALFRTGDFSDGYGRLVCLIPLTNYPTDDAVQPANVAYGDDADKGATPYYAVSGNPFVKVEYPGGAAGGEGIKIYDNTPASHLLLADTYQGGREAPPEIVREIIDWNGRIALLAGAGRRSEFYLSWLLSEDSNAGLYFSRLVSPTDPSAVIKGLYTHLGTQDGDKALRLIGFDDRIAVLFERKPPYIILGTNPTNIEIRPFTGEGGAALGLIARNAACLFGGTICYLTPNGLVAWDTATAPRRLSELVRKLVSPRLGGQSSYHAEATAKIALWEHGGRLYLALPTAPVDTEPNRILTFDPESGWSLFPDISATGGLDLPGSDNTNGHYVATASGNLALLTLGSGDKATAGATETAIPFALTTRAFGNNSTASKSPYRLELDLENTDPDDEQVFTVSMADNRGVSRWRKDVSYPAGAVHRLSTRPGSLRSETFAVSVSGSSKRGVVIGILRVGASVGGGRL